jgi:SNF2 family DNA or RNA helicase
VPIERNGVREASQRLRRMIAPFVLRRTKVQVLDELPPRTELVLRIDPEPVEAAHYEALRRQALAEAEAAVSGPKARLTAAGQPGAEARIHVLAQLMRLRRAACDARLVTPELELGQEGAKVRAFVQLAGELAANGHKTLVFSQFVDFLQLLRRGLGEAGLAWQYLDGATPAAERTRRVAAFQAGEGDVFLISLKAGGFGLNLTAADYVIIADPWWNPAAEDQAMGRAHRIGQQRPVTVYRLISAGTIEERILALHHGKRALADGILEAGESGGDGLIGTAAALPDIDELVGLLRS